jgi:hypothetical protein
MPFSNAAMKVGAVGGTVATAVIAGLMGGAGGACIGVGLACGIVGAVAGTKLAKKLFPLPVVEPERVIYPTASVLSAGLAIGGVAATRAAAIALGDTTLPSLGNTLLYVLGMDFMLFSGPGMGSAALAEGAIRIKNAWERCRTQQQQLSVEQPALNQPQPLPLIAGVQELQQPSPSQSPGARSLTIDISDDGAESSRSNAAAPVASDWRRYLSESVSHSDDREHMSASASGLLGDAESASPRSVRSGASSPTAILARRASQDTALAL